MQRKATERGRQTRTNLLRKRAKDPKGKTARHPKERKIKQPKEGKIKQPKEGKIKQPKEGKIKNPEVRDVAKGEGNCREGRGRKDQATRRGKPRKAIKQRRVRKRLRMPGRERTKKDLEREERNRR